VWGKRNASASTEPAKQERLGVSYEDDCCHPYRLDCSYAYHRLRKKPSSASSRFAQFQNPRGKVLQQPHGLQLLQRLLLTRQHSVRMTLL
jgi:hypothetical protein